MNLPSVSLEFSFAGSLANVLLLCLSEFVKNQSFFAHPSRQSTELMLSWIPHYGAF
jgi:hypothetical protein